MQLRMAYDELVSAAEELFPRPTYRLSYYPDGIAVFLGDDRTHLVATVCD